MTSPEKEVKDAQRNQANHYKEPGILSLWF